ncbi:hypothetical protein LINGRAHAP2_LOCUS16596 [Linum grandiflorum]
MMRRVTLLPLIRSHFRRISSSTASNTSLPPPGSQPNSKSGLSGFDKVETAVYGFGIVTATAVLYFDIPSYKYEKNKQEEDGVIAYDKTSRSRVNATMLLASHTTGLTWMLKPQITFTALAKRNVISRGAVFFPVLLVSAYVYVDRQRYVHKIRWKSGADSFEVDRQSWRFNTVTEKIRLEDVHVSKAKPHTARFSANGKRYYLESTARLNKDLVARLTSQKECFIDYAENMHVLTVT